MRDDGGMTRVRDRFLTSDENSAAFVAYRRDRSVELRNEIVTRHLDLPLPSRGVSLVAASRSTT